MFEIFILYIPALELSSPSLSMFLQIKQNLKLKKDSFQMYIKATSIIKLINLNRIIETKI